MLPKNNFFTWSLEQHSQQQHSHQYISGLANAYDKDGVGAPLSTITSTGIREEEILLQMTDEQLWERKHMI